MLHEKPCRRGPPGGDDVDVTSMSWKMEKKRRKYLPESSSSDAPTAAAQDHHAPISYAVDLDYQGLITDMVIVQAQDNALLPTMAFGEEEETKEIFRK